MRVSFLIEMSLVDFDYLCRGQIPSWESECSAYVLIMSEQVSDQTRKQIFKDTFRRKIDLRRMTSVCSGDRELARSLVVCALREIADDIEKGKWEGPLRYSCWEFIWVPYPNLIYKVGWLLERYNEDHTPER